MPTLVTTSATTATVATKSLTPGVTYVYETDVEPSYTVEPHAPSAR